MVTNTQAVIVAVGIAVAGIGFAWAQGSTLRSPSAITGCVVYAVAPTLADGYSASLTCDLTGKLRVTTS